MFVHDDQAELELWLGDDEWDEHTLSDWENYKKSVERARDLGFCPVHPARRTVTVSRTAALAEYLG